MFEFPSDLKNHCSTFAFPFHLKSLNSRLACPDPLSKLKFQNLQNVFSEFDFEWNLQRKWKDLRSCCSKLASTIGQLTRSASPFRCWTHLLSQLYLLTHLLSQLYVWTHLLSQFYLWTHLLMSFYFISMFNPHIITTLSLNPPIIATLSHFNVNRILPYSYLKYLCFDQHVSNSIHMYVLILARGIYLDARGSKTEPSSKPLFIHSMLACSGNTVPFEIVIQL